MHALVLNCTLKPSPQTSHAGARALAHTPMPAAER